MNEKNKKVIIGIDVSKDKLDIWDNVAKKHFVIKNETRSIGSWLKKTGQQYSDITILLEPTGGYEKQVIRLALSYTSNIYFVHPNHLHHHAKSSGRDAKTDKLACIYP